MRAGARRGASWISRPALASDSRALRWAVAAIVLGVAFEAVQALWGLGGGTVATIAHTWDYTAVEVIAVAVCLARAVRRRRHRGPWLLMSFGLLAWTCGDLVWTLWLDDLANPPFPSVADGIYLAMYPAMYVALMLLIRARLRHASAAQWLDGGAVALTLAAIGAGLVLPTVTALHDGRLIEDIVNLAYPAGDLMLLAFAVVAFSLSGWRPDRMWLLLGAAMAIDAVADLVFAYQAAKGTYVAGGILDCLWPAAMGMVAVSAWQPSRARGAPAVSAPHTIILPALAAAVALILLVLGTIEHIDLIAVVLAAAALVTAAARAVLTYLENVQMLRRNARDAVTDGLTGLGNRRRLLEDLETACADLRATEPRTLVFFDLDGFKRYNDTFGHAAGDALLARAAVALRDAAALRGDAYRLGGDEFCLLLEGRLSRHDPLLDDAARALSEASAGFSVTASYGLAVLPDDATGVREALQLADQRMYADKLIAGRQDGPRSVDVLRQLLAERAPDQHPHATGIGALAYRVGRRLELGADQLDELLRAAELHDLGKLAVPWEVLAKPGELDESEWRLVRRHPVIGERILSADPALRPVGRIVRASHERWDGAGYPDGLAGEDIPVAARIVAVCDALEAMTSVRPHRPPLSGEEAMAELRRHAGTQFDPAVVEALCAQIDNAPARPPVAAAAR
jgi:two-component system cell cycle response regulator